MPLPIASRREAVAPPTSFRHAAVPFFSYFFTPRFRFLSPGRLVDRELELVAPCRDLADDLLAAAHHPLTLRDAPREGNVTRDDLELFFANAPLGRDPGDPAAGRVPSYQFWMLLRHAPDRPGQQPPVRIAGGLGLRIGQNASLELYYGHIGYHVYPPARGNRYAERACRLLLPLARRHGLRHLWITCNPDNRASRRTCERLGGELIDVIPVPDGEPLYLRGDREKCRYRIAL